MKQSEKKNHVLKFFFLSRLLSSGLSDQMNNTQPVTVQVSREAAEQQQRR